MKKILFLTLLDFSSFSERNIYCDLLREFIKNDYEVYCISPSEKRFGVETHLVENGHLLKLKIGNIQKTNIIEKGISTLLIEPQFKSAIKKYFSYVSFDLILYSTPPITLISAIDFVKKRDHAKTYLLLKDIFPQNAVDLGMLKKNGVKSLIYQYFRRKEKRLYSISDRIGCMSQANVEYILKHNPEINPEIVEVCPNSIEVQEIPITNKEKLEFRQKFGIPTDKIVFVYGGNLGKPQGISFIIECLRVKTVNDKAFFLIVGDGTEYFKIEKFINEDNPKNVMLMKWLPKEDYDRMIEVCDVGMIFLDHRFTIPNFPSRLLAYMQAGLPVLACTDPNTDIGINIVEGGYGSWCESNSIENFIKCVDNIIGGDISTMGHNAKNILVKRYSVEKSFMIITNKL